MGARAALELDCQSLGGLASRPESWWRDVLGVVVFDATPCGIAFGDVPVVEVALPALGASAAVCEVWRARAPLKSGRAGAVRYRASDDLLFGCVALHESTAVAPAGGPTPLQCATQDAYGQLFRLLDDSGYGNLLRVWNYLPDINLETAAGERYRQFNSARHQAFLANRRTIGSGVPAACALGSRRGGALVVYFLASRSVPRMLENPRQQSAYRYPRQYGAHSPTFSRAALAGTGPGSSLLISGTASIVGHTSVHPGDAAAQTRESFANIAALVAAANAADGGPRYALEALKYKIYVRDPGDLPAVSVETDRIVGGGAVLGYLEADICRAELLVEIEAAGVASAALPQ
jgi:enamine deaminase RidA (YjgF/YER057c/UK114 family)